MSDRRQQGKYVPLRVRFRTSVEQVRRNQDETALTNGNGTDVLRQGSDLAAVPESQCRARQIKELLRLGNLIRAEQGLAEVLQQIAASVAICTGFRIAVINLINEAENYLEPVAFAGVSEEDQQILRDGHDPITEVLKLMRDEFRISQSYFISHKYAELLASITSVIPLKICSNDEAGGWHPEDTLLVPLYSPRKRKLLGILSLDDPEDGKVPTEESIEMAELFANQAAVAIDNARIFQEQEVERVALEQGIIQLREDLERLRAGDLHTRMRPTHPKLQPAVEVLHTVMGEMGGMLGSMQVVTQAVDEHTRNVQHNSELLMRDTKQQDLQAQQVSSIFHEIVDSMSNILIQAQIMSRKTIDAIDVTTQAQEAVGRAVDGMGTVREATMQSARAMKVLSERGQEINETILAIADLTTRMHHLALNAAIEATRAGEHGQGFAVIAQEIRTLAVHSGEAARKVTAYIRMIQHEMTAVSQSVEQSTQSVVVQTELVTQTGVALDAISVVTEQLAKLAQGICASADGQSTGSRLVVGAIKEISRMTEDITLHMRGIQQSLDRLAELADALRSRMSLFRISEH